MADRIDVFISSTAHDLPDHRRQALDACLRQGMFPLLVERAPADSAGVVQAALDLVDQAGLYLGIFGFRYGYVPAGYDISITQMEYEHAVERGIPRLIFIMHEDHPLKASDLERGAGAAKIRALRERLMVEQVVNFFRSPEELRALVINSLAQFRTADPTAFHYVSDIPQPPEPYIAHPYTLLQTGQVVGRQAELNLLTQWVAAPGTRVFQARVFNIVALGGMGKSALTWKWFNDIAPQEMKPLAGRMWWSFYESDAHFENFIIRALAYVSHRTRREVEELPAAEREAQLLAILDREPFLLVLDGLERILSAYARMDAAHLSDSDYDQQTANFVAGAMGLPASAAQSFTGQHRLRKTADPRAGLFLRKLANVRAARILVSTRLYPADLQTITGEPARGAFAVFLKGLTDDDAVNLWREFGVSGSREELLRLFHTFDNYPLLIRALAGLVAEYRPAPGDFDAWRKANPAFNPFSLDLKQVQSHVLAYAIQDLDGPARQVLHTIAAFRMPAAYDTLTALLVKRAANSRFPAPEEAIAGLQQTALKVIMQAGAEVNAVHGDPAAMLWACLRDRRLENIAFERDAAIANTPHSAAFLCSDARLVLELIEGEPARRVRSGRQRDFEAQGYHVLCLSAHEITRALGLVLARVLAVVLPRLAEVQGKAEKLFENEYELDRVLTNLEDRGLLGWDRRANRYDLHPIVRGVTWSRLDTSTRQDVYTALHHHFEAIPGVDQDAVERLEDLTPAIELYSTLVGLGRYDDACDLFYERLSQPTLHRLSASRQRAELLEMLFPDSLDQPPRLERLSDQAWTINALALAYDISGQPGHAAPLYRRQIALREREGNQKSISIGLCNLADALRLTGALYESEAAVRRALAIARTQTDRFHEAVSLQYIGLGLAARGAVEPTAPPGGGAETVLRRSLHIFQALYQTQSEGLASALMSQAALWRGDYAAAATLADKAWELAAHARHERDFIRAARLQGTVALGLDDLETADERLHHALARARAVQYRQEELPALVALAELRRRQGNHDEAQAEYLDAVWEAAERGPYRLDLADACLVLARLESDAGHDDAALQAATRAYQLSWCDGPPFAYHWGLSGARRFLEELGAPIPDLPPFEPGRYPPMPPGELNPADEYHVPEYDQPE